MLINKLNLLVSKFASKTKSRYAIPGVHIGPKGTTATDGYRLVRISLPKGRPENFPAVEGFEPAIEAEEMVLGLETLDKVGKAIPKSSNLPMLEHAQIGKVTNGKVKIAVTDLETSQVFGAKTLTDFGTLLLWFGWLALVGWVGWQQAHDPQWPQNAQPCVETRP